MAAQNQSKYINKLQNKRVLVFGGTSGIGYAVVEGSIEFGAQVIISGSKQESVDKTLQRIKQSYPASAHQVSGFPCDLEKIEQLEASLRVMFDHITENGMEKINHLVFTSGNQIDIKPLSATNAENIFDTARVRITAAILVAKVAQEYMFKSESGDASITFTSGTNSEKPAPGWAVTAGWGSSLIGLVRGLAIDLAPHIRVNQVSPGAIHTELIEGIVQKSGPGILNKFSQGTLVQRIGQPEEVAEAYLYLMRDRFATGQMISSDGGRLLK